MAEKKLTGQQNPLSNSSLKVIFDASVLVTGQVKGDIQKTGLYRVSYQLLDELGKIEKLELILHDAFNRERELILYVQRKFPGCSRIKVYSRWNRFMFFPLGNLADRFREIEYRAKGSFHSHLARIAKNILLLIFRSARKLDNLYFVRKNIARETNKADLYFSTYFSIPEPIRKNRNIRKVFTIHDLIPIKHPEYFSSPYNQILLKETIEGIGSEDYIICVSDSTKRDLLEYKPSIRPDQVVVAHLAASGHFHQVTDTSQIEEILKVYDIPSSRDYLLSVCTLEPRKNLGVVIEAYKNLLYQNKTANKILVLVGAFGWESHELIHEITDLNSKYPGSVITTGFIPDEHLAAIYSGAYAFLYPSLYEGFGLPPLEAMKCGVPVITSNNSSLPEVVGKSGILIDPAKENELRSAIYRILHNPVLRDDLADKAKRKANSFSWRNTAEKVLNTFEKSI